MAAWIDDCRRLGTGGVITYSVLRRSYRDFLTRGRPEARIVYLHGERPLIEKRLAARKEHSMVPDILDHHFAILEEPERLLSLRNDVGLLAEEYDPRARRQTGNFPQAFSHLALIMSALSLHDVGTAQQRGQREEARLVNPA